MSAAVESAVSSSSAGLVPSGAPVQRGRVHLGRLRSHLPPTGSPVAVAAGFGSMCALSRARHQTMIHAIADDIDQAVDDLRHDWTGPRSQRWISATHEAGYDSRYQPEVAATARTTRHAAAPGSDGASPVRNCQDR
jgi:hypothetical protein